MGETAKTQVCPHLCVNLLHLVAWDAVTDVRRLVVRWWADADDGFGALGGGGHGVT